MAAPRPWNENGHAIVQAAFSVDFALPPVPSTIREVLSLHPRIREEYPRKREITATPIASFETGREVQPAAAGEPQLGGFTFDSLKPDGEVERAVSLVANKLSIMRADYESLDRTWKEVRALFEFMLPVLLERSAVIGFHLEYHDRFVQEGGRGGFQADMVFRRGSRWLAPNVFEAEDLWHSHHGFFEYLDRPHKHQLLNVVEAQLIPIDSGPHDSGSELAADIKLKHRVLHGVARAGGAAEETNSVKAIFGTGEDAGLLDAYMCGMHDRNKLILVQSINEEMCRRIKLELPK